MAVNYCNSALSSFSHWLNCIW